MLGLENPGKIFLITFPIKAIVRCFIFVFHERTQENICHRKIAIEFSKNEGEGGFESRLEFFRKFIRFGSVTRP